jgi:tetratricopeptide (TPR) repeat protein
MTAEEKTSSSQKRPINLCPWLVTAGALLLYGITLQHWVTLGSLPIMARITGWDWHPIPLPWRDSQTVPLFLILTSPIRLLPVAWEPFVLNAFSAVCAALTLGLLAASVRLLPHDRTREQRLREGGEFALLSLPTAFMPVLFAVVMMAMQLSFWRDATVCSHDILDVLVFAILIYCLLKFRISQNDTWLSVFAFVYGLGTTNNWALIGFLPFFLVAVIWIKGISFFNVGFLARSAGCGILGLLLYLLIPAIGSLSGDRTNFWVLLHLELGAQSFGLHTVPRWIAAVAALPTILPLLFAGIKWPSFEGELSAAGSALTKLMFRLLHVVFLLLALVLFFDFKYSPSQRMAEAPVGFLTFYYMGALCIGYFSGYILLVYGKNTNQSWERRGRAGAIFNVVIAGLLWLLAVAAPVWLACQNIPRINAGRSSALADYSREMLQDLPAKPVIILSDDPPKSYLLDAACRRAGKPNDNIMIDTASLPYREYIAYLVSRYPGLKKASPPVERFPRVMSADTMKQYLYSLSRQYSIYYLHSSFGYFFETFYMKPHGLVYELQPYTNDAIEESPPTSQEIDENQAVWARLQKNSLAELPSLAKLDPNAGTITINYSVALDLWGVCLQKAGRLQQANAMFAEAVQLDPRNYVARINREYNDRLQKNDHRPIDAEDFLYKALLQFRSLKSILQYNGPADDPGLDLEFGKLMAEGHDFRQAAILFERRLQLLPGDAAAELDLAKTFVDWGQPDKALQIVGKLRTNPSAKKWDVSRVEALAYLGKNDFPTAERILLAAFQEDPHDEGRISILADFYRVTAYAALRDANEAAQKKNAALEQKDTEESRRRFNNSLAYLDQELKALTEASHNSSNPYGVPETLLKKAEVEMMLKTFKAAIATLDQIMELQPKDPTALLNRAIAEIQIDQYAAAKEDYKALRKLLPNQPYVVDYGLADVANRQKDASEETRCLKRYLETAPDDLPEYKQVKERLRKLESH